MTVASKSMRINEQRLLGFVALFIVLTALVFTPSAARAAGQYEPNDEIGIATGPIGPQVYSGAFETDQDEDWYWIPLAAQQQIDIAVHFSEYGCGYGGRASFIDSQGETLGILDAILQDDGGVNWDEGVLHYRYTTPPASSVYFLRFSGVGSPCAYEFEVSPASVFAPGLANPVVHFPEPDNFKNSAHGPLDADVLYSGAIDADGDVDQLYMEAKPSKEIEMTMIGYCNQRGEVQANITLPGQGKRENELQTTDGYGHGVGQYETGRGGRIYVAINGGVGCHWQFRATPSSALAPAPESVDPCTRARDLLRQRKRAVKRLSRALHEARSHRARGHLHHRIEAKKRSVRAAKHLVAVKCRS